MGGYKGCLMLSGGCKNFIFYLRNLYEKFMMFPVLCIDGK